MFGSNTTKEPKQDSQHWLGSPMPEGGGPKQDSLHWLGSPMPEDGNISCDKKHIEEL